MRKIMIDYDERENYYHSVHGEGAQELLFWLSSRHLYGI